MKIVYVHHANRKKGNPPSQDDDITKIGKKDAKLVARILLEAKKKGENIKSIYTSSFYRCKKTAEIINKKLNIPIYFDERLNEGGSVPGEVWLDIQNRVRNSIKDIVFKYGEKDTVICVTSGVNVAAFISLANKQKPSVDAAFIGVPNCCPLAFKIDKSCFIENGL